jgi:hypothetical protein
VTVPRGDLPPGRQLSASDPAIDRIAPLDTSAGFVGTRRRRAS